MIRCRQYDAAAQWGAGTAASRAHYLYSRSQGHFCPPGQWRRDGVAVRPRCHSLGVTLNLQINIFEMAQTRRKYLYLLLRYSYLKFDKI